MKKVLLLIKMERAPIEMAERAIAGPPKYQMMAYTSNASATQPSRNSPVEAQKAGRKMVAGTIFAPATPHRPVLFPPRSRRKYSTMRLLIRIASGNINVLSKLVCFSLFEWHPC